MGKFFLILSIVLALSLPSLGRSVAKECPLCPGNLSDEERLCRGNFVGKVTRTNFQASFPNVKYWVVNVNEAYREDKSLPPVMKDKPNGPTILAFYRNQTDEACAPDDFEFNEPHIISGTTNVAGHIEVTVCNFHKEAKHLSQTAIDTIKTETKQCSK
jgi:hypothetical protein